MSNVRCRCNGELFWYPEQRIFICQECGETARLSGFRNPAAELLTPHALPPRWFLVLLVSLFVVLLLLAAVFGVVLIYPLEYPEAG